MKMINKLGGLILGLAPVLALGHVSLASAASSFEEDFSAGSLPPQLESVGGVGSLVSPGTTCCGNQSGGPVFENGAVRFQGRDTRGDSSGGLRSYLRTIEADYSSVSFVAEVTVTIPPAPGSPNIGRNIVFFGLGPVLPVDIFGGPVRIGIGVATLPTNFFPRFQAVSETDAQIDNSCGGNGTHRMRLEWNAQTKTAVASIDQDYSGGTFVADCTLPGLTSFSDNLQPVANAGDDITVDEGDASGLNGSGSLEPNGTPPTNARIYIGGDWDAIFDDFKVAIISDPVAPLNYEWLQLAPAEPVIALSDPTAAQPTFTAPFVSTNTTFTFQLTVNDGTTSDADTVDVTVANINTPPVADAGTDFVIKPGAEATLDGSASYDDEGDLLAYAWAQVSGTTVTLDDPTVVGPKFIVPNNVGNVLTFVLQVDDGFDASVPSDGTDSAETDTVAVTIVENAPPDADAGTDQIKNEGDTGVALDGTASLDQDGDTISYSWVQLAGTTPVLNLAGANTVAPTFDLPAVGANEDVVFELTVTDDDPFLPKSDTDTVTIRNTNSNNPPTCDLAFASTVEMWPPNHKMKSIEIGGVTDVDNPLNDITVTVTGVTQDEPVNGTGDGDTSPDAIIGDPADSVLVRSERSGNDDGRVYSIQFTASDGFESCDGAVLVTVAKNRKSTAVDSGQNYDSTLD